MKMSARRQAVLVDMDGTLANVSTIRHFVDAMRVDPDGKKVKKDFEAFHRESEFVPANKQAIDFCRRHHKEGHAIVIVTARMEEWRPHTRRFIDRELVEPFGVEIADQYHRADGDYRKDYEVKKEILAKVREKYDVIGAIDDNPNIVKLWEEEAIPEIEVVPGWDHDAAAKYAAVANRVT